MTELGSRAAFFGPGAFRLFLAFLVFISHVSRFFVGTTAVMVFLILSGYWVSHIFLSDRYNSTKQYLIGRVLRLWPIIAVSAIIAVGLRFAIGAPQTGSFWSTIFFLGLASRDNDVIGTAWSLDIELQFYLVLPLVIWGLLAVGPRWRPWLAAGTVVATAAGVALGREGVITALVFAPVFAAGIWLQISQWQPSRTVALASLAVLLIALATYVSFVPVPVHRMTRMGVEHFSVATVAISFLAIPFIAWNVHSPSNAFDRWLGDLSYPFYLIHFPIIAAALTLFGNSMPTKVIALFAAAVFTVLLNYAVDRPIEAWRRRMVVARRPPVQPVVPAD